MDNLSDNDYSDEESNISNQISNSIRNNNTDENSNNERDSLNSLNNNNSNIDNNVSIVNNNNDTNDNSVRSNANNIISNYLNHNNINDAGYSDILAVLLSNSSIEALNTINNSYIRDSNQESLNNTEEIRTNISNNNYGNVNVTNPTIFSSLPNITRIFELRNTQKIAYRAYKESLKFNLANITKLLTSTNYIRILMYYTILTLLIAVISLTRKDNRINFIYNSFPLLIFKQEIILQDWNTNSVDTLDFTYDFILIIQILICLIWMCFVSFNKLVYSDTSFKLLLKIKFKRVVSLVFNSIYLFIFCFIISYSQCDNIIDNNNNSKRIVCNGYAQSLFTQFNILGNSVIFNSNNNIIFEYNDNKNEYDKYINYISNFNDIDVSENKSSLLFWLYGKYNRRADDKLIKINSDNNIESEKKNSIIFIKDLDIKRIKNKNNKVSLYIRNIF